MEMETMEKDNFMKAMKALLPLTVTFEFDAFDRLVITFGIERGIEPTEPNDNNDAALWFYPDGF